MAITNKLTSPHNHLPHTCVHVWDESIVSRKAVGVIYKPCRKKTLNFVLEIAHFGANVTCVKIISKVPMSAEGARSSQSNASLVTILLLTYYQLPVSSSTQKSTDLDRVLDPKKLGWRSPHCIYELCNIVGRPTYIFI